VGNVLITDEPQTLRVTEPELLIEEARERQRKRHRWGAVLVAGVVLVVLGVGIARIGRSNNPAPPQKAPKLPPAIAEQPGVVYEKVEVVVTTPHVPTVLRTGEIWFSTAAPWAYRELLTIAGEARFEVGAQQHQDPKFGREQLVYLYDARSDTIYRTGANLLPTTPAPSPRALFKRLLAQPGVVLAGTRMFEGHKVYVARSYGSTSIGNTSETMYVDTATYRPLLSVATSPDLRSTVRILVYKTLPATPANLKLTSLARSHPRAHVRPAPPRIDALYGKANQIGTFGGSDLGPTSNG
jgi:hypothetical protein